MCTTELLVARDNHNLLLHVILRFSLYVCGTWKRPPVKNASHRLPLVAGRPHAATTTSSRSTTADGFPHAATSSSGWYPTADRSARIDTARPRR